MKEQIKQRVIESIKALPSDATGFSLNWEDEDTLCWLNGSLNNGQWTINVSSYPKAPMVENVPVLNFAEGRIS